MNPVVMVHHMINDCHVTYGKSSYVFLNNHTTVKLYIKKQSYIITMGLCQISLDVIKTPLKENKTK